MRYMFGTTVLVLRSVFHHSFGTHRFEALSADRTAIGGVGGVGADGDILFVTAD